MIGKFDLIWRILMPKLIRHRIKRCWLDFFNFIFNFYHFFFSFLYFFGLKCFMVALSSYSKERGPTFFLSFLFSFLSLSLSLSFFFVFQIKYSVHNCPYGKELIKIWVHIFVWIRKMMRVDALQMKCNLVKERSHANEMQPCKWNEM